LLRRLSKADTWAATVLVDELDAGDLESAADDLRSLTVPASIGTSRRRRQFSPLLFWRLWKAYAGSATVLVEELDAGGA
jgi:hypothetical protein